MWYISPSVYVIFDFFHQHLIVFLSTDPFVSLGRFISRYFIIFVVMVNKIVSSIFLSDLLFLLFINARDFFVLQPTSRFMSVYVFFMYLGGSMLGA